MQFVKPRQKEKDGHLTGSALKSQCGIPVELAGRSLVTLVSRSRRDTYLRIVRICMWSPKSKWAHPGSKWLVLDYTLEMNLKDVYPGNQLEICQLRTHRILRGKAFSYGGKVWHHWVRSQSRAEWRTGESKKSTGLDLGETQSWLQILVLLFTFLTVPYPKSFMEKMGIIKLSSYGRHWIWMRKQKYTWRCSSWAFTNFFSSSLHKYLLHMYKMSGTKVARIQIVQACPQDTHCLRKYNMSLELKENIKLFPA